VIKLPKVLRIFRELMRDPRNPAKRLEALAKYGQILVPGYRFYWPHPTSWSNERFNRYLEDFSESEGFNTQRRWSMSQLLRLISEVPGDTAECGVYRGAASYAILLANSKSRHARHHHIFDSFEGISRPVGEDGVYWTKGDLTSPEEIATEALREFTGKTFYKGWIPTRFPEVSALAFSFVHVDVDLYAPTKESLGFFYSRLSNGGIFVCDDYGMQFCPGATKACDEFLADKAEKMLSFPAGGGFFIKGVATSPEIYD
jgi:O-methyltransferase